MPTTLTGVLLFVVLLLPGIAYQVGRERRSTTARRSTALRETAAVVAASVFFEIIVVACTSWVWSRQIDFEWLARDRRQYLREHPALLAWWGLGLLGGAIALAYGVTLLLGRPVPNWGHGLARRLKVIRPVFVAVRWGWRQLTYTNPSTLSAWWMLFEQRKASPKRVGLILDDGSYVEGNELSFNNDAAESSDRDIILGQPISYRPRGEEALVPYRVGAVCVSARRVVVMFVTNLPESERFSPSPAVVEGAGEASPE